jgi:hypothetical protein
VTFGNDMQRAGDLVLRMRQSSGGPPLRARAVLAPRASGAHRRASAAPSQGRRHVVLKLGWLLRNRLLAPRSACRPPPRCCSPLFPFYLYFSCVARGPSQPRALQAAGPCGVHPDPSHCPSPRHAPSSMAALHAAPCSSVELPHPPVAMRPARELHLDPCHEQVWVRVGGARALSPSLSFTHMYPAPHLFF